MGSVTCDLVSQSLGLDSSDLITESLVGLEIQSKLWIVTLNQGLGGTLDGLSSNSTLNKLKENCKKYEHHRERKAKRSSFFLLISCSRIAS